MTIHKTLDEFVAFYGDYPDIPTCVQAYEQYGDALFAHLTGIRGLVVKAVMGLAPVTNNKLYHPLFDYAWTKNKPVNMAYVLKELHQQNLFLEALSATDEGLSRKLQVLERLQLLDWSTLTLESAALAAKIEQLTGRQLLAAGQVDGNIKALTKLVAVSLSGYVFPLAETYTTALGSINREYNVAYLKQKAEGRLKRLLKSNSANADLERRGLQFLCYGYELLQSTDANGFVDYYRKCNALNLHEDESLSRCMQTFCTCKLKLLSPDDALAYIRAYVATPTSELEDSLSYWIPGYEYYQTPDNLQADYAALMANATASDHCAFIEFVKVLSLASNPADAVFRMPEPYRTQFNELKALLQPKGGREWWVDILHAMKLQYQPAANREPVMPPQLDSLDTL